MEYETELKTVLIAEKYKEIMNLLEIPETADNKDTPKRVAKALVEMTSSLRGHIELDLLPKLTVFENKTGGLVELEQEGIEFSSLCSHHHLPFFGKVRIKYIPNEKILGLSKFKRLIDYLAKKPQVQEDFTLEIGCLLVGLLEPKYLLVEVYDCTHTCMTCRGVHSHAKTTTRYEYGNSNRVTKNEG